jgi:hypothetical protein
MGRSDAHARRDELLEFFREAHEAGGGANEEPDDPGRHDRDSLEIPVGT